MYNTVETFEIRSREGVQVMDVEGARDARKLESVGGGVVQESGAISRVQLEPPPSRSILIRRI